MAKKIGILTAGSDSPGINATIRAIGKAALGAFGMDIVGFQDGFLGLIENQTIAIKDSLSGILTSGGTILGTSRDLPYEIVQKDQVLDMTGRAVETYHKHNLEALVCIGGRETQEAALKLIEKGLNVVTLPKAIDNDVNCTDQTIGFDTAMEIAAQSIDRLHSTAHSHHRIIIVEVMGRYAGWLTLGAGLAGGADVILIPEIPYDIQKVAEAILLRKQAGRGFSIVAVSESLVSLEQIAFSERLRRMNALKRTEAEKERIEEQLEVIEGRRTDTTIQVSNQLKELTGLETRITILGYLLRGGAPSAADRILASELGTACVSLINDNQSGVMVAKQQGKVVPVPLDKVIGEHKLVPLDHLWVQAARRVGTNLGD